MSTSFKQKANDLLRVYQHQGYTQAVEVIVQALAEERKAADEELAIARERLGPAGYKILEEYKRMRQALELIAAPKRSDGTYNRSREACEELAREALKDPA